MATASSSGNLPKLLILWFCEPAAKHQFTSIPIVIWGTNYCLLSPHEQRLPRKNSRTKNLVQWSRTQPSAVAAKPAVYLNPGQLFLFTQRGYSVGCSQNTPKLSPQRQQQRNACHCTYVYCYSLLVCQWVESVFSAPGGHIWLSFAHLLTLE